MNVTTTETVADGVHALPMLPPGWAEAARGRIDEWLEAGKPDAELAHLDDDDRTMHYQCVSQGDHDLRFSPLLHRCISYHLPRVREIVGEDVVPGDDLQIALRVPGESDWPPHLDGMDEPGRMEDPMVPTAILMVYLSDVGPEDGATGVWPELRADVHRYGRDLAEPGLDPDQHVYHDLMARAVDIPATPVTGPAGSANLFRSDIPHCNLLNSGSGIRYALIMRLYRPKHCPLGPQQPTGRRALQVLSDPGAAWG